MVQHHVSDFCGQTFPRHKGLVPTASSAAAEGEPDVHVGNEQKRKGLLGNLQS